MKLFSSSNLRPATSCRHTQTERGWDREEGEESGDWTISPLSSFYQQVKFSGVDTLRTVSISQIMHNTCLHFETFNTYLLSQRFDR